MANVTREDIDNLTMAITVSISKDDYNGKFTQELEKYRKKAHMKGFRKGKTPMALIKKMYGRAVLADIINETLQKELLDYLSAEKLNYLGQPIPAEGEMLTEFDPNNLIDYKLKFDLGLAPEFEIKGIESTDIFTKMVIDIPNKDVEEDLFGIRKRLGEQKEVEDEVGEKDMVKIDAEELADDKVKADGWASTFSVLFDSQLTPSFFEKIKNKKAGDVLDFNINEIEKDRDQTYIRKYFLNVEEADKDREIGEEFRGTISAVNRVQPAVLNQEFYDKAFGESKVTSEEEARGEIKKQIENYYEGSSNQLLYRDIQKSILDKTTFSLPEAFLNRWLKITEEKTDEQMESDFPTFVKGLKWTLIRQKLIEGNSLEVTEEEILEGFKNRIRSYFGGYGDELVILNTANRLMQDKKQVDQLYQELITEKLFKSLGENATVNEEKLSKEAFADKVKAVQEEDNADISGDNSPEEEIVEEVEE